MERIQEIIDENAFTFHETYERGSDFYDKNGRLTSHTKKLDDKLWAAINKIIHCGYEIGIESKSFSLKTPLGDTISFLNEGIRSGWYINDKYI